MNFFGVVADSVVSVQFLIVPCSSLYFFSRSIGPFQCLVNANYRVLICCTCHFQSGSLFLFILVSSVCKSLQCLSSTLTQGGEGGHLFRLTFIVLLWGGRNTANNITGMCGECLQYMDHTGFAPAHRACAVPVYSSQAPGCSAGELSKVGPGLYTLHRSKLIRLRFSGTPQRYRLGWACVLCPFQIQGAQATSCLASALSQV